MYRLVLFFCAVNKHCAITVTLIMVLTNVAWTLTACLPSAVRKKGRNHRSKVDCNHGERDPIIRSGDFFPRWVQGVGRTKPPLRWNMFYKYMSSFFLKISAQLYNWNAELFRREIIKRCISCMHIIDKRYIGLALKKFLHLNKLDLSKPFVRPVTVFFVNIIL